MTAKSSHRKTKKRIRAELDAELLAKIRRVAGRRGVSAFLRQAAREHLARLELCGALSELRARSATPPSTPHVAPVGALRSRREGPDA
jgi:hypothetical protein